MYWWSQSKFLSLTPQSMHRVATATFWRTCHHDGKICPGWWGWGVHSHPLSLYLPSRTKLDVRWEGLYTPPISTLPLYLLWEKVEACNLYNYLCTGTLPHPNDTYSILYSRLCALILVLFCFLKISLQQKYENTIARGLIFSLFNFTKKQPTEISAKKAIPMV